MSLNAGTKKIATPGVDQYAHSMAAVMEHAFMEEWKVIMDQPVPQSNNQMRLLFIAIAQGVLRYLKDHENSITVPISGSNVPVNIAVTGTLYEPE